jgi:hypothetical protein
MFSESNDGYNGNTERLGREPEILGMSSPDWQGETPPHIKQIFYSSTQFSIAIFRTQLFNAEDMPNVVKIQSGFTVQSLASYPGHLPCLAPPRQRWVLRKKLPLALSAPRLSPIELAEYGAGYLGNHPKPAIDNHFKTGHREAA